MIAKVREFLPEGRPLPDELWQTRHRGVVWLLTAHAPGLAIFALARGNDLLHSLAEGSIPLVFTVLATSDGLRRTTRSVMAGTGLITSSAIFVHLSGGVVEVHFHFFVMIGVLTLYQEWKPFLVAVGYVIVHHGIVGVLDPSAVYNHPAAINNPWKWAVIHGAFVLAASVANLLAWRLNEHQALHDPLTGLPNRILLTDRVEQSLARRDGASRTALLYVDLDGFKAVNDRLGHEAGDRLLTWVSRQLASCVRAGDTTARLGGDEFAILLTDIEATQPLAVAQRVLDTLAEPFELAGCSLSVDASVGVAFASEGIGASDLFRNADVAMYAAKRKGRGGYQIFEAAMHAELLARVELEAALRQAVVRDEFRVHYQPLVQLHDGTIDGVEALVRWDRPGHGLVPPNDFIPVAEQTGSILEIGAWVLHTACQQVAQWRRDIDPALTVSVNLSPRQLDDREIVPVVRAALEMADLDPGALILEITETELVQGTRDGYPQLEALRALGVKVAIDDFGTGYSSLSYLRRLPIDGLKIDKDFIDHIAQLPEEAALVSAILHVADTFGLRVVAEGVEQPEQAATLERLGCRHAQGFLFARPADSAGIEAVLKAAAPPSLRAAQNAAPSRVRA